MIVDAAPAPLIVIGEVISKSPFAFASSFVPAIVVVLTALGLYKEGAFTPDQSPWLAKVRSRLKPLVLASN